MLHLASNHVRVRNVLTTNFSLHFAAARTSTRTSGSAPSTVSLITDYHITSDIKVKKPAAHVIRTTRDSGWPP